MTVMRRLLYAVLISSTALPIHAQPTQIEFRGTPKVKISEGGTTRNVEALNTDKAGNTECLIVKRGEKYLWASRENLQLARIESGSFITFIAMNGSGWIRTINPEFKTIASTMSATEASFDYVEHLMIGLRSVTYFGDYEQRRR
jgi:hypothetical protein